MSRSHGVRVGPEALVGGDGEIGYRAAMTSLARGRIHMAALAVGSAQRALDESVTYAATATQGGTPIGNFQLVQAMIADQQTGVLAGRALAREAARLYVTGDRPPHRAVGRQAVLHRDGRQDQPIWRYRCTAAPATCGRCRRTDLPGRPADAALRGHQRDPAPHHRRRPGPAGAAERVMTLPLEGITVVAIEQAVAAPLATRNLADLGARVIKVERIDGGDLARGYDHVVHGTGAHFVWLNRGKESLAVDLKSAQGRDIVRSLIDRADVFLQNLAPGAVERLGLGADELRSTKKRIDRGEHVGLRPGRPAGTTQGLRHAHPGRGRPRLDHRDARHGSEDRHTDLRHRRRHVLPRRPSSPRCCDAAAPVKAPPSTSSMLDATVEWMGHALYTQMHTGAQPPRMGLSHSSIAPYDAYPTSDGEVLIGVQNDRGWRALVTDVFGVPELADDPRFATNVARVAQPPRMRCCRRLAHRALDDGRARRPPGHRGRPSRAGQTPRPGHRSPPTAAARSLAHRRHRARIDRGTAAASHFRRRRSTMGDVPALGQHTHSLLVESGMDTDAVEDALARGVVGQADQFEPLPRR